MSIQVKSLNKDRPKKARKRKTPTREEKARMIRDRIMTAAVKLVGELGYREASVALIVEEADVALGTFYRHFKTRQDLLNEVLPYSGESIMSYIGGAISGSKSFREMEERAVIANFEYLKDHPGHYRILNEAEFAAPEGHKKHFENLIVHYVASMKRSIRDGLMPSYSDSELETAACAMIGARSYLYLGFVKYGDFDHPPREVIDAYLDCHALTSKS